MKVRSFVCRSYEEAEALLKGKSTRTVCNNTVLSIRPGQEDDCIRLRLHGHIIAFLFRDRVRLFSRGWHTATTKGRLNSVLPIRWSIYQEKGLWWLRDRRSGMMAMFFEGVEIRYREE
ncbi:hypothetical protein LCGC14_0454990 [marine sediment metagenome]|uniref:Uncharacterized protein n=1 Tax=marine sediment metagenome TaxID=412755 RepID=A0A0F9SGM4_9ZZZZ